LKSKKIFILLPDGVGLRNFAFTSFVEIGEQMGWEVVFWNQTPFNLADLGYKEIKLKGKPRAFTDLVKRGKISTELDHFEAKFNDKVYHTYNFPSSNKGIKSKIKNAIVTQLSKTYRGEHGLQRLREKLKISERKSPFYQNCKDVLEREKPDFIFCTNQRPVNAIAPLTAAQDLGIPTGTFIFSWDNLPKATMVVEPDFYFVWSEYMKKEMLNYYPFIDPENIFITGSPQFETHHDDNLKISREDFYNQYGLDKDKNYLCFSGDDKTTSPHDELYLRDVAVKVKELNNKGGNIGMIFRRSPADFSLRYNDFIEEFSDILIPLDPLWKKQGDDWSSLLPTKDDLKLLSNTIQHTFMVINVGSSMVFDYVNYRKPCGFINYNPENINLKKDIYDIYKYIHFQSMPSPLSVLWINNKEEIKDKIQQVLNEEVTETLKESVNWFNRINQPPAKDASENIWTFIDKISD